MLGPPNAPAPLLNRAALELTDNITSASTILSPQSYTVCMWCRWDAAFSGGRILTVANDAETAGTFGGISLDDVPVPTLFESHSNTDEGDFAFGPTLGIWYFVASTGNASNVVGYVRTLTSSFSILSVGGASAATVRHLDINFNGAIISGSVCGYKAFNKPFTAAQVWAESTQLAPVNQSAAVSDLLFTVGGGTGVLFDSQLPGRKWTNTNATAFFISQFAPPVPLYAWAQNNVGISAARVTNTLNAPLFGTNA